MKSLEKFRRHYEIEDEEEAKREYQKYQEALELFKRLDEKREARGPVTTGKESLGDEEKK